MPQSLIGADLSSAVRRQNLKRFSKMALDLSIWAAEGRADYFIASQLSMLTREFAQVVTPSPVFADLQAVLDYLGYQIQCVVGKAHKPEAAPSSSAVCAPHETELAEAK